VLTASCPKVPRRITAEIAESFWNSISAGSFSACSALFAVFPYVAGVAEQPTSATTGLGDDQAPFYLTRRVDRALGVKDESLAKDINSLDEVPI
jgi:hypothetical protein